MIFRDWCGRKFAQKKGWKKVAIFTDVANDYSKGLTKAFKDVFPKDEIVAEESYRGRHISSRNSPS